MAYNYSAVSAITPEKETWNIKVKVIRSWIVHDLAMPEQKNYLDLILQDEQGTKIQATIVRKLIRKFEAIVRVGLFYTVSNVSVAQNGGTVLTTDHPYKLRFHPHTCMQRCSEFKVNGSEYDFITFEKMRSQTRQEDILLRDIKGFVVRIFDVQLVHVKGVDKQKLDVELEDESRDRITCSLWEGFAQQILNYKDAHPSKPMVIVLQSAKVNGRTKVSNSMFASCQCLSKIPGEEKVYLSSDSVCKASGQTFNNEELFSVDFLNSVKCSGIPNHRLILKIGVPIILLRNIDQKGGLCNGTRLIVTKLGNHVLEARIISGRNIGNKVYIPRMILSPSDHTTPVKFQRRQFPVLLCFAMTINKSQGQTLSNVGLFLPKPVFTHGQLYVAISRVKSQKGLKILCLGDDEKPSRSTINVVFKEVFQNLN